MQYQLYRLDLAKSKQYPIGEPNEDATFLINCVGKEYVDIDVKAGPTGEFHIWGVVSTGKPKEPWLVAPLETSA